jgi:hypothetical protein
MSEHYHFHAILIWCAGPFNKKTVNLQESISVHTFSFLKVQLCWVKVILINFTALIISGNFSNLPHVFFPLLSSIFNNIFTADVLILPCFFTWECNILYYLLQYAGCCCPWPLMVAKFNSKTGFMKKFVVPLKNFFFCI